MAMRLRLWIFDNTDEEIFVPDYCNAGALFVVLTFEQWKNFAPYIKLKWFRGVGTGSTLNSFHKVCRKEVQFTETIAAAFVVGVIPEKS